MDDNKLGVALTKCYFCGEGNVIVMNRRLTRGEARKVEKLNGMVVDMTPCSKCEELMSQGIILITINDAMSDVVIEFNDEQAI